MADAVRIKLKRNFDSVASQTFDIIVIGGGIIGAGIARDAVLRRFKTLLVEKEDFAYGTTSRSSRLIHGGMRYLRRLELGLVHQDLREREILLNIAPHLVHPLPFVIPISNARPLQRAALPFGLMLYDLLFYHKSLPSHQRLSRSETLELEPGLEQQGLAGSYLYYDCQSPFVERLCLENVLSATEHGATALNHTKVVGLLRNGNGVSGVKVQDMISGETYETKARIVINATGHWVDSLREMLGKSTSTMIRRTKGIHLLVPQISCNAVVLFALADNRLFFVIPWQGYSLIGTTDTDYSGDLDAVEAEKEDVTYLLTEVRRIFPSIDSQKIFHASAGLRALARSSSRNPSDVSRSHKLVDHEREDGIHGFVSVLGGKITAYRAVAEQVVDLVCKKLSSQSRCTTDQLPLPGAPSVTKQIIENAASDRGITVEIASHLANLYGSRFTEVLELLNQDPQGAQGLCSHSPDILAQVQHAVEYEGALTVDDFLLRRSALGLGPCLGLDALEHIADEMGSLLHWSQTERQKQIALYRTRTVGRLRFAYDPQS